MVRSKRFGEPRVRGDACLGRPGGREGPRLAVPPMQGPWVLAYALLLALGAVPAVSAEQLLRPALVEIPAGAFDMGSDRGTPGTISRNERPVHRVTISAFRMAATEVTQGQFEAVMGFNPSHFKGADLPVGDVGWYEAVAYANALSRREGLQPAYRVEPGSTSTAPLVFWDRQADGYRLPTEAEWEYAARAGTTTAYFFGDDASQLKDYAWYFDNAPNFQYAKIGGKKPNPWGLYDIYGNVCEWTLDQYTPATPSAEVLGSDWVRSKTPYPHVARGGTYDDDPEFLRSAARKASDPLWKQQDPQLPKSIWYLTDATWLGFRIVRPLEIPTVEEMFAAWNNGVAKE